MKKIIIPVLISVVTVFSSNVYADDYDLTLVTDSVEDEYIQPPSRHRTPPMRMQCIITADGVTIDNINTTEITLFEIRDDFGVTLTSTTDETSFLAALYACSGIVEVRFLVAGRVLRGYINL